MNPEATSQPSLGNRMAHLVAVVIPCYKVRKHILDVIAGIGSDVHVIYCVDDACPEQSGNFIEESSRDPRVRVLRHTVNQGVGGATVTGYLRAAADGATAIVKVDGDGQMDPALIPLFVGPILAGKADYCKGNRFWDLGEIGQMPLLRRIGNLALSFMAKASTGYWDVFDPTNGYTAIHANVVSRLPVGSISKRYFFETDILFRLNTIRAVVMDVPMDARYGDETSNLKISQIIGEFAVKHVKNFCKRILYKYYLRDLSIASFELVASFALLGAGALYGGFHWWVATQSGQPSATGTVILPALAILSGLQFLLAFIGYDIASIPRRPIHGALGYVRQKSQGLEAN